MSVKGRPRTAAVRRVRMTSTLAQCGRDYIADKVRANGRTTELWDEAGQLGYLGVAVPEEYGGGGRGIYELHIVAEELAAAGCPLLLLVVSPAICGTVLAAFGTAEQKIPKVP